MATGLARGLLADLRQDLGDLLLAADHLGPEADAGDLAVVVPARLDQDARLVLRRDGQAVHHRGQPLAIELAELLGYVLDRVDAGIALEAVVIGGVVEALEELPFEVLDLL